MAKFLAAIVVLIAVDVAIFCAVTYVGAVNVAADRPHARGTVAFLDFARERSIAQRAADITVPPLDDAMVAKGAGHYREMCAQCHLAPGLKDSELRDGLNPMPPNLSVRGANVLADGDASRVSAREFWIVKHGIKMTGMPAFGKTHDDNAIWAIVAFLQKLPDMTPGRYQQMTAASAGPEQAEGAAPEHHEHPTESANGKEPT